jgi:5-methyltetrahydropteroyltriglutamate--homocysteine methyltransferase
VVTDGEYRRGSWLSGFTDAVEGFVSAAGTREWKGDDGNTVAGGSHRSRAIAARLRKTGRIAAHESRFLARHAGLPFKITLPSPIVYLSSGYKRGITDKVYRTRSELAKDLVAILREEILSLVAEGVPYIQIDAPQYTQLADPSLRDWVRQSGWDPDHAIDEAIAADKACIDGIRRPGRTIAVHLCRGNYRGMWRAQGGYDPLAERLFNAFDVDRFLLEYDSERAGTFAPLRFVPKGKTVVLGLVTTKRPQLESQDELLRRIEDAARHVPIEYLALSPQCGFATQAAGNPLSFDDQRRKLELIVDTARKVWH